MLGISQVWKVTQLPSLRLCNNGLHQQILDVVREPVPLFKFRYPSHSEEFAHVFSGRHTLNLIFLHVVNQILRALT